MKKLIQRLFGRTISALMIYFGANTFTENQARGLCEAIEAEPFSPRPTRWRRSFNGKLVGYFLLSVLFVALYFVWMKLGGAPDLFGQVFAGLMTLLPALASLVAVFLGKRLVLTSETIGHQNMLGHGLSIEISEVEVVEFDLKRMVDEDGLATMEVTVRLLPMAADAPFPCTDSAACQALASLFPAESRLVATDFEN